MNKQEQGQLGYVFIYGTGLHRDVWSEVVQELTHPYLLVEYPLRDGHHSKRSKLTLEDYVAYMEQQVEKWPVNRFILVAHSLGGVFALRIAAKMPDRVAGLAAVGALIPKNGGSFLSTWPLPIRLALTTLIHLFGTFPPKAILRSRLRNHLTSDKVDEIVDAFIPDAVRVFTDRTEVSVPDIPKLYVILTKDKVLSANEQQRIIANLSPQSICRLKSGHLPMISDPHELNAFLEEFRRYCNPNDRVHLP